MIVQSPLEMLASLLAYIGLLASLLACVGIGVAGTLAAQRCAAAGRDYANGKKA